MSLVLTVVLAVAAFLVCWAVLTAGSVSLNRKVVLS
jgi:hypothetical protein